MKLSIATAVLFLVSADAFAPATQHVRPSLALEAKKGSKRKLALKTVGRVAGALGTIAVAGTAVPGAANAAKAAKAAAPVIDPKTLKVAGYVAGGVLAALGLSNLLSGEDATDCTAKISSAFPGALKNKDLVNKVANSLEKYDYANDNTIVATSLCADEVNRVLEKDFSKVYKDNFSLGGLAGFPFAGVTGFGAMASHIPDGGSCLVVFGPHVGVGSKGDVGTVERRGRDNGGACCGSAIAASGYVASVTSKEATKADPPKVPTDAQQNYVGNLLLPYAPRLEKAADKMVELPYALYDAQKKMVGEIIKAGAGAVAGDGKIAVVGGIQLNTPKGTSDYFKPMSFEVYDNSGKLLEDLSSEL